MAEEYVTISKRVLINVPTSDVDYYYGPWSSIDEAKSKVPYDKNPSKNRRAIGKTVGIINETVGVVEYWWKNGIQDDDLVEKKTAGGGLPEGLKVAVFDKNANEAEGRQNSLLSDIEGWVVLPETTTFRYDEHEFEGWATTQQGEPLKVNEVRLFDDKTTFYAKWGGQVTKYDITIPAGEHYNVASVKVDDKSIEFPYKSEPGLPVEIAIGPNPTEGYEIKSVSCDVEVYVWEGGKLSFVMPGREVNVEVNTVPKKYTVSVGVNPQGTCGWTINGEGATEMDVDYEGNVKIVFSPEEEWKINDEPTVSPSVSDKSWDSVTNTLTFTMPAAEVTVTAQTRVPDHSNVEFLGDNYDLDSVTPSIKANDRVYAVPTDAPVAVTLIPDQDWQFTAEPPTSESGVVDVSEWNSESGTFNMVASGDDSITVYTEEKPTTHSLTLSVDENCSITTIQIGESTPEPPSLNPGETATYENIDPETKISLEYQGEEITLDVIGIVPAPVLTDNWLIFDMPAENVTVNATAGAVVEDCKVTFNLAHCQLETFNGEQVSTNVVYTPKNKDATFTITSDDGYEPVTSINDARYDSETGVFTISASVLRLDEARFTATAAAKTNTVTVTCNNCTYTQVPPNNPVAYNTQVTLTFTADTDYTLNGATVETNIGISSLDINNQISFRMPDQTVTIIVTAKEEQPGETITLNDCVMISSANPNVTTSNFNTWLNNIVIGGGIHTKSIDNLTFTFDNQTNKYLTSVDIERDGNNDLNGVTLLIPKEDSHTITGMLLLDGLDKPSYGDENLTYSSDDSVTYNENEYKLYVKYYEGKPSKVQITI